jgi:hypothetical protein
MLAGLDPTYERASDQARRALLETDMMKMEILHIQDDAEKKLFRYTGLDKNDLIYLAYAAPAFTGTLSTRPFKNFKLDTDYGTIRPQFTYGIYNKEASALVVLTKEF